MCFLIGILFAVGLPAAPGASGAWGATRLDLRVVEIVGQYPPHADFCRRFPDECDLSGPAVVEYSDAMMQTVVATNRAVNGEILFALDVVQYDAEEYWSLPASGRGDCEDKALEKRHRLVQMGLPRGAMRLALVFHKTHLISHGVMTLETTAGTYVLDTLSDQVFAWDQAPYNFEARERPDGGWDRFDQNNWSYER